MKRRFEVTYYEYGLTKRTAKRFFFRLSAYLYMGWLMYEYGNSVNVSVNEHDE